MNSELKGYCKWMIGMVVGLLVVIGGLNLGIDPFNRFGNNRLGVYISAEREWKVTKMRKEGEAYDVILTGSSRSAMIDVSGVEMERILNAGFAGGSIREVYYFIKKFGLPSHAYLVGVHLGGREPVVEGVDEPFLDDGLLDVIEYAFSANTLECSFKTIRKYLIGAPRAINEDGSFNMTRWFDQKDGVVDEVRLDYLISGLTNSFLGMKEPTDEDLGYMRKLKGLLEERGNEYVVFVYPEHERVMEGVIQGGGEAVLDQWREKAREVFPEIVDLSISEYCKTEGYFKMDPMHFKPNVGTRMINEQLLGELRST